MRTKTEFVEITSAGVRDRVCTTCRSPGSAQLPRRLIHTVNYNVRHHAPAESQNHLAVLPVHLLLRFHSLPVESPCTSASSFSTTVRKSQLIARRVREAGVYSKCTGDVDDAFVREQLAQGLKGIILSGSHASAYEEGSMRVPHAVFELGVPVLGICYGMQSMAQQLGGVVSFSDHREFGYAEVRAHGHTSCSTAWPTSRRTKATACSRSG